MIYRLIQIMKGVKERLKIGYQPRKQEKGTFSVHIPKEGTVRSLITCFESLISQMKKEDPESVVVEIVLENDRLIIRATEKINVYDTCNDTANFTDEQENIITYWLPKRITLSKLSQHLEELIKTLFKMQIGMNGSVNIKELQIKESALTIHIDPESREVTVPVRSSIGSTGVSPESLMLIDGSNLLTMSYYATLPRDKDINKLMKTRDGIYTNAIFAMIRKMFNLLRCYKPTHLAVCWDVSRSTFRREIYFEYKTHRSETEPALKEQFDTAQQLFKKMGIYQLSAANYEADDLIGFLKSSWQRQREGKVLIVSSDRDFFQLLDVNTSQIISIKGQDITMTYANFKNKYGIEPYQWIDVKAILGDSSDNVPGVKGVGEKAAFPLIQNYGSLEEVYKNLDHLKNTRFKRYVNSLVNHEKMAKLSKTLVTILLSIPGEDESDFNNLRLRIDKKQMVKEFERFEFISLLQEIKAGKYRVA